MSGSRRGRYEGGDDYRRSEQRRELDNMLRDHRQRYQDRAPEPRPSSIAADLPFKMQQALNDLTINSRPLIARVTDIARTGLTSGHSRELTDLVLAHFAFCSASSKLPTLYAIDSILKNVGGAYVGEVLGGKIRGCFGEAIKCAGLTEADKYNFGRVLATWLAGVASSNVGFRTTVQELQAMLPPHAPVKLELPPSSELVSKIALALQDILAKPQDVPTLERQSMRIKIMVGHLRQKGELAVPWIDALEENIKGCLWSAALLHCQPKKHEETSSIRKEEPQEDTSSLYKKIYDDWPLQCRVCARRYSAEQREVLQIHLDSHFRDQARVRAGKARIRGWMPLPSDWLLPLDEASKDPQHLLKEKRSFVEEDEQTKEAIRATFDTLALSRKKRKTAEEADKRNVVPFNGTAKPCPACLETIETVYDEKLEQWLYLDAVQGKCQEHQQQGCKECPLQPIYHEACIDE